MTDRVRRRRETAEWVSARTAEVAAHVDVLRQCTICPKMHRPAVAGEPVLSRVLLVGQAPGIKEPLMGRPFAWTAGKTLFSWFTRACGVSEDEFRTSVYMAAVCRCFPGRNATGGDRVPDAQEVVNCSRWLLREFELLRPELVLPVGRLAIEQFLEFEKMADIIGQKFPITFHGHACEVIPLPHPSGASPWHRIEPGKTLLNQALSLVAEHPAWKSRLRRSPRVLSGPT
jgi:uracil-DNA glycosylase